MTYSKETKDKFIDMRAEGMSLANIAKELSISRNTAVKWDRDLLYRIRTAKAFKDEEMMEKYRITKEKRIQVFGERLLAIRNELANRDLSEIPTPKLFDMETKYYKALEAEDEAEDKSLNFLTKEEIGKYGWHRKKVYDVLYRGRYKENDTIIFGEMLDEENIKTRKKQSLNVSDPPKAFPGD